MKDWMIFVLSLLLTTSVLANVLIISIETGLKLEAQNQLEEKNKEVEYWKAVATIQHVEREAIKNKLKVNDDDWTKLLKEVRDAIVKNVDLRKKIYEILDASGIDWKAIKKDIDVFIELIKKEYKRQTNQDLLK